MQDTSTNTKIAVVTGASSGIGRVTAILLADKGYTVALVGRRQHELEQTLSTMNGPGLVCATDLAEPGAPKALIERVIQQYGRIDALVNNAGMAQVLPLSQGIDETAIRQHYEINAIAPALLIAAAWPHLMHQQDGCIVNISTMGTVDPFEGLFAYASAKAAVNLMVKSCAKEGAPHIRAFAIAPGCVETPMLRGLFDETAAPPEICVSPQAVAELIVDCITGRHDEDNAATFAFLRENGKDTRRKVF